MAYQCHAEPLLGSKLESDLSHASLVVTQVERLGSCGGGSEGGEKWVGSALDRPSAKVMQLKEKGLMELGSSVATFLSSVLPAYQSPSSTSIALSPSAPLSEVQGTTWPWAMLSVSRDG